MVQTISTRAPDEPDHRHRRLLRPRRERPRRRAADERDELASPHGAPPAVGWPRPDDDNTLEPRPASHKVPAVVLDSWTLGTARHRLSAVARRPARPSVEGCKILP